MEKIMDKKCFFHNTPKDDCNLCDGYGNETHKETQKEGEQIVGGKNED